ncbi:glycosyltransferase [Candidatus Altiarchaeota archaeon]
MKISAVIPTYNSQSTIISCIESLTRSEGPLHEVLVVDSGSDDDTMKLVGMVDDDRVRFIQKHGSTTGANRNTGVDNTGSDHIVFLDSDCTADPDLIKNYAKAFEHADVIAGNVKVANPGKVSNYAYMEQKLLVDDSLEDGLITGRFFWVMNFGITRQAFTRFPDMTDGEDVVFINKLKKTGVSISYATDCIAYHHYPETLDEFLEKKVSHARSFLKNRESFGPVSPESHYGRALEYEKIGLETLKDMIRSKDVCMECDHPCRFKTEYRDYPLIIQNINCMASAIAGVLARNPSYTEHKQNIL